MYEPLTWPMIHRQGNLTRWSRSHDLVHKERTQMCQKLHVNTVFSPGRGLVGFPQEKLRWRIKSQEDAPVWAQRQATCQTDFRVGTLE